MNRYQSPNRDYSTETKIVKLPDWPTLIGGPYDGDIVESNPFFLDQGGFDIAIRDYGQTPYLNFVPSDPHLKPCVELPCPKTHIYKPMIIAMYDNYHSYRQFSFNDWLIRKMFSQPTKIKINTSYEFRAWVHENFNYDVASNPEIIKHLEKYTSQELQRLKRQNKLAIGMRPSLNRYPLDSCG